MFVVIVHQVYEISFRSDFKTIIDIEKCILSGNSFICYMYVSQGYRYEIWYNENCILRVQRE